MVFSLLVCVCRESAQNGAVKQTAQTITTMAIVSTYLLDSFFLQGLRKNDTGYIRSLLKLLIKQTCSFPGSNSCIRHFGPDLLIRAH